MANIKSNHSGPLALPGGPTIPPGATVAVERWRIIRGSFVVQSWLAAKVIEVADEELATKLEGEGGGGGGAGDDQPKTAVEVLAMADTVHFMTFKVEAAKLLGPDLPAKKAEIVAMLDELATKPE